MTNQNIAITIGVQEYEFFPPLKYAANDAKKMRDFLLDEADFDDVFYFSDNSPKINGASTRPTRSRLELVLEDEVKKLSLKTGDNLWFFLLVMVVERIIRFFLLLPIFWLKRRSHPL